MNLYEIFSPLDEKWSQKYKSSINCSSPKGFSQKAHCAGRKKNESVDDNVTNKFVRKFLPWVARELDITDMPDIQLLDKPMNSSFGTYDSNEKCLYLVTGGRHPVDVLRTLAHELTHHKQNLAGVLNDNSGATGTAEENEANAQAGIVMRNFNQANPDFLSMNESLEDTPPEVTAALNQAAQKNGYKNWQDVKDNPKSSSAIATVSKLAATMLRMPAPRKPTKTF